MELVNHYCPALPSKGGANNSHPLPAACTLLAEVTLQHHPHLLLHCSWTFNGSLLPTISSPNVCSSYSSLSRSASNLLTWHHLHPTRRSCHCKSNSEHPLSLTFCQDLGCVFNLSGSHKVNATTDYYKYQAPSPKRDYTFKYSIWSSSVWHGSHYCVWLFQFKVFKMK